MLKGELGKCGHAIRPQVLGNLRVAEVHPLRPFISDPLYLEVVVLWDTGCWRHVLNCRLLDTAKRKSLSDHGSNLSFQEEEVGDHFASYLPALTQVWQMPFSFLNFTPHGLGFIYTAIIKSLQKKQISGKGFVLGCNCRVQFFLRSKGTIAQVLDIPSNPHQQRGNGGKPPHIESTLHSTPSMIQSMKWCYQHSRWAFKLQVTQYQRSFTSIPTGDLAISQ